MKRVALLVVVALTAGCMDDGTDAPGTVHDREAAAIHLEPLHTPVRISDPASRNSEFWAAQDPNDLDRIAVGILDSDDEAGGRTCTIAVSDDAGKTWTITTPPAFHSWRYTYDPWLTYTPDGTLHVACIENANPDGPFVHARSPDGGRTWDEVRAIPGGGDKSIIGSDREGVLRTCSSAGDELPNYVSRDGGATWSEDQPPDVRGLCSGYLTGPDGTVYLATVPEDTFPSTSPIRISRLPRGGVWALPVEASVLHSHYANPECDPLRAVQEFAFAACVLAYGSSMYPDAPTFMHPQFAISPVTGAVIVAHHDFREPRYELALRRSTDQAATFHGLPGPAGAQPCSDCHVTRPVVAYGPTGLLGMLWKTGDALRGFDVHFAVSPDDGDTWSDEVLLASTGTVDGPYAPTGMPPDPERLANGALAMLGEDFSPGNAQAFATGSAFLSLADSINGDGAHYWGMAATEDLFVPMWVAAADDGKPQVFAQQVRIVGP